MPKKYYAIFISAEKTHLLDSWSECQSIIKGVSNVKYRAFTNKKEAQNYLNILSKPFFTKNKTKTSIRIYVDGSFNGLCKKSAWAWVATTLEGILAFDKGLTLHNALSRNIDGELEAVKQAILWAQKHHHHVTLVHDYEGIARWADGTWKAKSQIAKDYVLFLHSRPINYHFEKVKAHSHNKWNDYVDALAKSAF